MSKIAAELVQLLQGPKAKDFVLPPGIRIRESAINKVKQGKLADVYKEKITDKDENKESWLTEVFEDDKGRKLSEAQIKAIYRANIAKLKENVPPSFQIKEIDEAYQEQQKAKPAGKNTGKSNLFVVEGVDALFLPFADIARGGIVQVASQFNALESPGVRKAKLGEYAGDWTQGPRVVMPCAHALIQRDLDNLMDYNAFQDVIPDKAKRDNLIKDGYVQWGDNPKQLQVYLGANNENVKKLRILSMWVKPELSDTNFIQCYTAAPPTNGSYGNAGPVAEQDAIAETLVVEQYKAIAKMAVIRSREIGGTIPLHLTLVGGGVFANSPKVLQNALQEVRAIIANENVDLYIHAHSLSAKTKAQLKDFIEPNGTPKKGVIKLDAKQFMDLKSPIAAKAQDKVAKVSPQVAEFALSPERNLQILSMKKNANLNPANEPGLKEMSEYLWPMLEKRLGKNLQGMQAIEARRIGGPNIGNLDFVMLKFPLNKDRDLALHALHEEFKGLAKLHELDFEFNESLGKAKDGCYYLMLPANEIKEKIMAKPYLGWAVQQAQKPAGGKEDLAKAKLNKPGWA